MNYCQTCRRHLNGAYSCPGCGAPVDPAAEPPAETTVRLPAVTGEGPGAGLLAGEGAQLPPPEEAFASRSAEAPRGRTRRGRQRFAVYGVGAVAVAGALAMFSMAALSGGTGGGDPAPAPSVQLPPPPTATASAPGRAAPSTPSMRPYDDPAVGHRPAHRVRVRLRLRHALASDGVRHRHRRTRHLGARRMPTRRPPRPAPPPRPRRVRGRRTSRPRRRRRASRCCGGARDPPGGLRLTRAGAGPGSVLLLGPQHPLEQIAQRRTLALRQLRERFAREVQ